MIGGRAVQKQNEAKKANGTLLLFCTRPVSVASNFSQFDDGGTAFGLGDCRQEEWGGRREWRGAGTELATRSQLG